MIGKFTHKTFDNFVRGISNSLLLDSVSDLFSNTLSITSFTLIKSKHPNVI